MFMDSSTKHNNMLSLLTIIKQNQDIRGNRAQRKNL